jgi:hypothetical protein
MPYIWKEQTCSSLFCKAKKVRIAVVNLSNGDFKLRELSFFQTRIK